ncbi:MAG: helix-turn-helix domain-containing protein [Gammaproteobacteria bacterium]|nr:helix-turn-helix domain-containing protein [Gammaproteobacteria bacterium]
MNHTVESVARERGVPVGELLRLAEELGLPKASVKDPLSIDERKEILGARTVAAFAEELQTRPDRLLSELAGMGAEKGSVDAYLSIDEQRYAARRVDELAREAGLDADALLRMLEEIGRPKSSAESLVTAGEQELLSDVVRATRMAATVRGIRADRGLNRANVAEAVGISERQLARIEAGEVDLLDPRQSGRLGQLAAALDVTVKDLYGSTGAARDLESRKDHVPVSALVSPQARSGFARIRERYRWTMAEVMELTPLMFVLIAEGSLEWRRKRVEEMREAHDGAHDEMRRFLAEFREQLEKEAAAIRERELRRSGLSGGTSGALSGYLLELARGLGYPAADGDPTVARVLDSLQDTEGRCCGSCGEPIGLEHIHCPWCGARAGAG